MDANCMHCIYTLQGGAESPLGTYSMTLNASHWPTTTLMLTCWALTFPPSSPWWGCLWQAVHKHPHPVLCLGGCRSMPPQWPLQGLIANIYSESTVPTDQCLEGPLFYHSYSLRLTSHCILCPDVALFSHQLWEYEGPIGSSLPVCTRSLEGIDN